MASALQRKKGSGKGARGRGNGRGVEFPWHWVAMAVIVAGVMATFWPALAGEFTTWDDEGNVVQNPYLHPVSYAHLVGIWSGPFRSLYIPLVYTSYMVEMGLGGAPWIFHATNLALHCGSAVLVFLILRRLLGERLGAEWRNSQGLTIACGIGTLVFAVHPLQAEPVSWITGRKDVLSGFLGFAALWCYLAHGGGGDSRAETMSVRDANSPAGGSLLWRVAAAGLFGLSLLSKPAGVALPLAVVGVDVFGRGRTLRQSLRELWPWFLIAAVIVGVTLGAQPIPDYYGIKLALWQRPLVAADSLMFYVKKVFAPVELAAVYGWMPWEVVRNPLGWVKVAGALALVGFVLWRRGLVAAGGLFFIVPLLPVLGFLPFVFQTFSTVADRYVYVSMFGVSLLVAAVLLWPGDERAGVGKPGQLLLAGGVIVLLAFLSNQQCRFWNNSEVLWKRAVAIAPNSPEPHSNLGHIYHQRKQYGDAETEFRKALELKPDFGEAMNNLGLTLLDGKGDPAGAAEWFQRSIAEQEKHGVRDARYAHPVMHLGVCWLRLGRVEDAEKQFRAAISVDPGNYAAHLNLGFALLQEGKKADALEAFREASRLRPGDPSIVRQIEALEASM